MRISDWSSDVCSSDLSTDYKPHIPRYIEHCRNLLLQGVGLAIFGTNSEANSLGMAEKRQLLDALLQDGLPAGRMMPGTGACSVTESIEMTRHADRKSTRLNSSH